MHIVRALERTCGDISEFAGDGEISQDDIHNIFAAVDGDPSSFTAADLAPFRREKWDDLKAVNGEINRYGLTIFKNIEKLDPVNTVAKVDGKIGDEQAIQALSYLERDPFNMDRLIRVSNAWTDRSFLTDAFEISPSTFIYIPYKMKTDADMIEIASPFSLIGITAAINIDPDLRLNEETKKKALLGAFQRNEHRLIDLIFRRFSPDGRPPAEFQLDPADVKGSVRRYNAAFAEPALSGLSAQALAELACERFDLMDWIREDQVGEVWPFVVEKMKARKLDFPPEMTASYPAFREEMDRIAHHLERLRSIDNIYTIWKHDQRPVDPEDIRPVTVFVMNRNGDISEAFKESKLMNMILESELYRVFYYDSETDSIYNEEFFRHITGNGEKTVFFGSFSGHGTEDTLQMGPFQGSYREEDKKDIVAKNDTAFIDPGDFVSGQFDFMPKYFDPNGQLYLESCSNGRDGDKNPQNLANLFASVFPESFNILSIAQDFFVHWATFIIQDDNYIDIKAYEKIYKTHGTRS